MSNVHRIPRLMLVTDRQRASMPLPELVRRAIDGGVDLVQIREKDLSRDDLSTLVGEIIEAVEDPSRIVVNGAIDVAVRYGTGVHLPELGASVATARAILGPEMLIGRSVHAIEAAMESDDADYLVAGHVFDSTSKPELPPLGLAGLRLIVRASSVPVIAIGGITVDNLELVLETGAHGIAVISAINNSADPEHSAGSIRRCLDPWFRETADHRRNDE